MGNYSNKFFYNIDNDNKDKSELKSRTVLSEQSCTASTPSIMPRKIEDDPRSVSLEITRTPIQVNRNTRWTTKSVHSLSKQIYNKKDEKTCIVNKCNLNTMFINSNYGLPTRNFLYSRTSILVNNTLDFENFNLWNKSNSNAIYDQRCSNVDILDPRSPAADFDRTPILKLKSSVKFKPSLKKNFDDLKGSKLDSISRSPCQNINLFNSHNIQTLPNIILTLNKSCSFTDNLNRLNSSSITDDLNTESSKVSFGTSKVIDQSTDEKLIVISQSSLRKQCSQKYDNALLKSKKQCLVNNKTTFCESHNTKLPSMENTNNTMNFEEKFVIWRDLFSEKLSSSLCSVQFNNLSENLDLNEIQRISTEFNDTTITSSTRNNCNKEINMTEELIKKDKSVGVSKKNITNENTVKNKQQIIPKTKICSDLFKNRTPLGNRSNNNEQHKTLI